MRALRSPPARRLIDALVRPLTRFLQIEAASSVLLLGAALGALLWASSRWSPAYEELFRLPFGLSAGPLSFVRPVSFWINDGLMVVFFFVAGLKIRREIHSGALSSAKRAALPVAAALGGMVVPALIYTALNGCTPSAHGWGVPMATDIAFAVGVLALLGKRVPRAVRTLLLALAIIDDIGAVFVTAVFYSSGVAWSGLGIAALGLAGVVAIRTAGAQNPLGYIVPGVVVWAGLHRAGVHPALAGVVLGLMTPVTPAMRLETALHPWVAYGVMPLFALANAGVDLRGLALDAGTKRIALGVFMGLVVGKPLGVVGASAIAERVGLAKRPLGVAWSGVALVGLCAGIGFTMAIFIAGLAFTHPAQLGAAKLAVLAATAASGALTFVTGWGLLPRTGD